MMYPALLFRPTEETSVPPKMPSGSPSMLSGLPEMKKSTGRISCSRSAGAVYVNANRDGSVGGPCSGARLLRPMG